MKLSWVQAVKQYHMNNGTKYKVPRKGTPEYIAVRALMNNNSPQQEQTNTPKMKMEITNKSNNNSKLVNELLEDIEMSKATEMAKDILSKHIKEAKREILDTFSGEGIDDLLSMIPENIVSKKDVEQVKNTAINTSKGNININDLKKSWSNIKNVVKKIDNVVKKEKSKNVGNGLNQIGGNIFEDIGNLIKPLLPVLQPVAKIANINIKDVSNVVDKWGDIKNAIDKVDVMVKKNLNAKELNKIQGSGLGQLGGFFPLLLALIPLISSALSTAGVAVATGAATYAGTRLAKYIGDKL